MVTLKDILFDVCTVVNSKGLKPSTIAKYQNQVSMIQSYLPRTKEFSSIIPKGIDTEMDLQILGVFLEKYEGGPNHIPTRRIRRIIANYIRRSFERIS